MKTEVVLKLLAIFAVYIVVMFNENRGCIEIYALNLFPHSLQMFNENRGCIEIVVDNFLNCSYRV